jgi:hypothetical protein
MKPIHKKRNHVVRYPNVRKEHFFTLTELKAISCFKGSVAMLKAATALPPKTVFDWTYNCGMTYFHILLPDGKMFSGVAIKKEGDKEDLTQALLIASGRALAVWRSCCCCGDLGATKKTHWVNPYITSADYIRKPYYGS